MSEQVEALTRSVHNETLPFMTVNDPRPTINVIVSESDEYVKKVNKWYTIYKNIKCSSNLFNDVFGLQLTVLLMTVKIYYVLFFYHLSTVKLNIDGWFMLQMVIPLIIMTAMFGIVCGTTFTAQRVQNSANVLKENITKILINLSTDDKCYTATKRFLDVVVAHPIRTQAFGAVLFNKTLIPACIGCIFNYTVIVLQLNNII